VRGGHPAQDAHQTSMIESLAHTSGKYLSRHAELQALWQSHGVVAGGGDQRKQAGGEKEGCSQPVGTGIHAGDGPGLGHSTTNPSVNGRYRPAAQSTPSGLDRILRTVYAFGTGPLLRYVNQTLQAWVMRKFKSFWGHKTRARHFLMRLAGDAEGNEVRQVFVSSGLSDAFAEKRVPRYLGWVETSS
jgi:hypothetical protein